MENLDYFYSRIPKQKELSAGQLIQYFVYFLQEEKNEVRASDISNCYTALSLKPYSNVSRYLSINSAGRSAMFIKGKCGYKLHRYKKEQIANELSEIIEVPITENLIPITIFDNTPYYIVANAKQMCQCYDTGLYDATLVLMRKLVETLIIECFERHGIDNQIKDSNGVFYYLSDLIVNFVSSKNWNVSRNLKSNIEKVKKYGDLSAHNRRFLAKKNDIDSFKAELRQVLQEIILTIDYINWKRDS